MFRVVICTAFLCVTVSLVSARSSAGTSTATCTFQDGQQISLRYSNQLVQSKTRLPEGKIWTPGERPMFLFTQGALTIGSSDIPAGAYSAYLIPQHNNWILVLNKNVAEGSRYDEHEDVLRTPMQSGQINEPQPFWVAFAHIAPKQCNLRIYYGKVGTWAEFKQK